MRHSDAAALPDAQLVLAVLRDRADDAFSALYDRHTPRAFQVAWRILGGNTHEAEDVIQETWIRAIATLDRWQEKESFGAWLRAIVAHVAIDLLRRQRRSAMDADIESVAPEQSGEQIDLETAIATLPPGYRAVFVLHDIEGFTHDEIADQLGITATGPARMLALIAAASLIFITGALVGFAAARRTTEPAGESRARTAQDVARAGGAASNTPPTRHVVWY